MVSAQQMCLCDGSLAYQIHAGYPGTQHSGKATSLAPLLAASVMIVIVLATVPCRSSHTGSCWVTYYSLLSGVLDVKGGRRRGGKHTATRTRDIIFEL